MAAVVLHEIHRMKRHRGQLVCCLVTIGLMQLVYLQKSCKNELLQPKVSDVITDMFLDGLKSVYEMRIENKM